MNAPRQARELLRAAAELHDRRALGWGSPWSSRWTRAAVEASCPGLCDAGARPRLRRRVGAKYAACALAALVPGALAWSTGLVGFWALAPLGFYATEVQFVFLVPVALSGAPCPFRRARALLTAAGGTWRGLGVVLPIALGMLGGGFAGRGFARSWRIGCLATYLWHGRTVGRAAA